MTTGTPSPQQLNTPLRYRRRVGALTAGQLSILRQAFSTSMSVSDDTGYEYWAGIHGLPLPISCGNAHGTPYFLPWHRAYLYLFERSLRDRVADASLAWWDWRTSVSAVNPKIRRRSRRRESAGSRTRSRTPPVDPLALQQGTVRRLTMPPRPRARRTRRAPRRCRHTDEVAAVLPRPSSSTSRPSSRSCTTGCTAGSAGTWA